MNAPAESTTRSRPASSPARRIAVSIILGGLVFLALWLMAFSLLTSFLIGSGCCIVVSAASTVSDVVEAVLDAIAAVIFGILAAIAAVFAAIFSLFGS